MSEEKDTNKGTDTMSHQAGTGKGEEAISNHGKEAGRHDHDDDENGRPSGGRTARDPTSINPKAEQPIDPAMQNMPPA